MKQFRRAGALMMALLMMTAFPVAAEDVPALTVSETSEIIEESVAEQPSAPTATAIPTEAPTAAPNPTEIPTEVPVETPIPEENPILKVFSSNL